MRHHVILLQASILQGESYLTKEFNFIGDDNEIPFIDLVDEHKKLTIKEMLQEILFNKHFSERPSYLDCPDGDGKVIKVSLGHCTITELALAPTGCISIFFYDVSGLPTRQMVYDFRHEEK